MFVWWNILLVPKWCHSVVCARSTFAQSSILPYQHLLSFEEDAISRPVINKALSRTQKEEKRLIGHWKVSLCLEEKCDCQCWWCLQSFAYLFPSRTCTPNPSAAVFISLCFSSPPTFTPPQSWQLPLTCPGNLPWEPTAQVCWGKGDYELHNFFSLKGQHFKTWTWVTPQFGNELFPYWSFYRRVSARSTLPRVDK